MIAEQFIGKIQRGEYHRFPVSLEEREAGLTVHDACPDPPQRCEICGNGIWHYWVFYDAENHPLIVGDECARVATGGEPPRRYLAGVRQARADRESAERHRAEVAEYRNWWRAPDQQELRRMILSGMREERREYASDFYRRAYRAAQRGNLTPGFRRWVERAGNGRQAAARAVEAARLIRALRWCRLGRYDAPIVRDFDERQFPPYDDRKIWNPPVTEKQLGLLRKLAHRYRGQIAKLEPWQRY